MSKLKDAKKKLVNDISTKIKLSSSTYLFEYLGLSAKEMTTLRQQLKEQGVELKIYKNRLFNIAAKNSGYDFLDKTLTGPNAFVFCSKDNIAGARIIGDFAKEYDFIKFKGGIFEDKVVDHKLVEELSQIPNRPTLLSHLAFGLTQPLQMLSIGLNMIKQKHLQNIQKN